MKKYLPAVLGVLAFLLPLGLYLKTLSPTYIPVDSAEFTLCVKFWGLCHPPGFPFYIFLGHILTSVFAFGSFIFRVNFLSALYAALTVLVLYLTLLKVGVRASLAFLVSMMLAVSAAFWEYSISADVFSFATLLLALTFLFAFWDKPIFSFLALGFSASHFYITVILVPVLIWYFWGVKPKFRDLVIAGVVFSLGFVGQVLMIMRMQQDPVINWGHAKGISGIIYYLRRKEFGSIFLIKNPVLTFSVIKYFKHIYVYFLDIVVGFGVVLPILVPLGLARENLWKHKRVIFLVLCWLFIVLVQLFLLSTIDPLGADNPFQINKFYLVSYIPLLILIGIATQKFVDWFFEGDTTYVNLLLGAVVLVYLLSSFKSHNLSKNYYSQNMVLDAIEQLPNGSVGITVSHVFYFGGLYEQKIDGKFGQVTLIYFPNEFNRDNESYHPDLFSGVVDQEFVSKVTGQNQLGNAEKYILETISKNPGRDIYILQGSFEEGFFAYLKPYIEPYGLWWRVVRDPGKKPDLAKLYGLMAHLRNEDVASSNLQFKAQQMDTLLYAVSYNSTGVLAAKYGDWDKALELLKKSDKIRPGNSNLKSEIDLVSKTRDLWGREDQLVGQKDTAALSDLGSGLFNLGDYEGCVKVFGDVLKIQQGASDYSNYASCLAASGNLSDAKTNYQKALSLDPNLDLAKRGLAKVSGN